MGMLLIVVVIGVPLGFAALALLRLGYGKDSGKETVARRGSLGFFSSVATLVATAAGVWILFSPPQAASWSGLKGLSGYALGQAAPFFLIAIIGVKLLKMLPQGYSLPSWAKIRYGQTAAVFTLLISFFYMGIFLAAELTAIGLAMSLVGNIPVPLTVSIVAFGTWLYTNRGGFGSVVWTDKIQCAILLPLLLLIFGTTLTALSERLGPDESILQTASLFPEFGIEFGLTLFIAILAAQLFNQTLWQRAYACRNETVMRLSFLCAGLLMIPIILIAGSFGLFALQLDLVSHNDETELFLVMAELAPTWLILGLLIAALLLVMSSMDSLLNALSECMADFVADIRQGTPAFLSRIAHSDAVTNTATKSKRSLRIRHVVTSVLALAAALIAMQGYSVLYLFLVADLICAGTLIPLFYGLYNKKFSQRSMLVSAVLGILFGLLFMISPAFEPLFPLLSQQIVCFFLMAPSNCAAPTAGSLLLLSFISALFISGIAALLSTALLTLRKKKH